VHLADLPDTTNMIDVNMDFTLGAVVYFQDYMYMEYRNLCHYEDLFKKYEKENGSSLNYADPGTESEEDEPIRFQGKANAETKDRENVEVEKKADALPSPLADDDELDIFNMHSRMLLNNYFDETFRLNLFEKIFGERKTLLSAANINAMAKNSDLQNLLSQLDIEKIHNYCNEINIGDIFSDKETQIEAIINYLENTKEL
jgi:hypothetical protein